MIVVLLTPLEVEGNIEGMSEESLEGLKSVGTISIVLTEVLKRTRTTELPAQQKTMLREIGPVSEEAIKGDVRSQAIRFVSITDSM